MCSLLRTTDHCREFFPCWRVKFHKSSFWVHILAAGGPYWVLISQKNGSLLGPYLKAWGSLLVLETVHCCCWFTAAAALLLLLHCCCTAAALLLLHCSWWCTAADALPMPLKCWCFWCTVAAYTYVSHRFFSEMGTKWGPSPAEWGPKKCMFAKLTETS